eukprot:NODE_231_length_1611_cov_146.142766_g164_i0.p1 GENE.NODE_231_length_1611_cov_146.142766_g164_i0~~NODE_231_length_1611_cov_146.142766_g164_i0.p1  ORF type:complete len:382 (+),score=131.93 NODE_231_length_1611_cov_146.142766_g164_i0:32-1177(+)
MGGETGGAAIAKVLQGINTTLQTLALEGTDMGDQAISQFGITLGYNTTLRSLDLSDNVRHTNCAELAKCLSINSTLHTLTLEANAWTSGTAKALYASLQHNQGLEGLQIHNAALDEPGATALQNSLRYNTTLQELALVNDGKALVCPDLLGVALGALAVNTVLQTLSLRGQDISNVLPVLAGNTTLTALDLAMGTLGKGPLASLEHLATVLKENSLLTWLDLSYNPIGEGLRPLVLGLQGNVLLTQLDLTATRCTDDVAMLAIDGLQENRRIKHLALDQNDLHGSTLQAAQKLIERNTAGKSCPHTVMEWREKAGQVPNPDGTPKRLISVLTCTDCGQTFQERTTFSKLAKRVQDVIKAGMLLNIRRRSVGAGLLVPAANV